MPKKITLESLARMVASGFEEIHEKMATKTDVRALREEIADIRGTMATKQELHDVEHRLTQEIEGVKTEVVKLALLPVEMMQLEKRVSRLERRARLAE